MSSKHLLLEIRNGKQVDGGRLACVPSKLLTLINISYFDLVTLSFCPTKS